jgi:hypothetical protein
MHHQQPPLIILPPIIYSAVISSLQENSGLRELSYKTWDPSDSLGKLVGFLIIPSALVYFGYVREKVRLQL